MQMKQTLIKCGKCDGNGKVALDPALAETLTALISNPESTAPQLREMMFSGKPYPSVNAVNNRLEKLRKLGMIDRRKLGIAWEYFVKK
jgi:hypothetical protein